MGEGEGRREKVQKEGESKAGVEGGINCTCRIGIHVHVYQNEVSVSSR